jgi:hypothetical protein
MQNERTDNQAEPAAPRTSVTGWYHEGETMQVTCNGVTVTVRYVNRGGRRARIAITAPAGAVFQSQ